MIDAERPEALWLALPMVQAVLRESPSALACSSSVRNPADLTASASSLILEDCRAFILAVSGSGRWVVPEHARLTTGGTHPMSPIPCILALWLAARSPLSNVRQGRAAVSTNACPKASLCDAASIRNDFRPAHISFDVRTR